MLHPSRSHKRGASRSSETWGAGCGGRGCDERRTAHRAYGKTVWSWRPDAGVKSAMMLRICADDGGKKARSPGRARYKPSTHCRREGRVVSGCTCMLVCVFCLAHRAHETAGASRHPAFPAPSVFRRDDSRSKPRARLVPRERAFAPLCRQAVFPRGGRSSTIAV